MTGARVRTLLIAGLFGLLVARLVQALRGAPMPDLDVTAPRVPSPNHPTVDGGVRSITIAAPAQANPVEVDVDLVAAEAQTRWVEPVDGACPSGYPVKGNLRSGIFHEQGGFAYERTVPDRCYVDAQAAATDGLRPAKR